LSPLTLAISYFFHLVATVIWLGGLTVLAVMVHPAARRALADQPTLYRLLNLVRRRFTPLANFSLALLSVTGLFQMAGDPNYQGFLDFGNAWSVALLLKHIAFAGMVCCSLALQYAVAPALERTTLLLERGKGREADAERLARQEVTLTWVNTALGVFVLVFTAWMTAL